MSKQNYYKHLNEKKYKKLLNDLDNKVDKEWDMEKLIFKYQLNPDDIKEIKRGNNEKIKLYYQLTDYTGDDFDLYDFNVKELQIFKAKYID
jgi:hypothetical protein